MYPSVCCLRRGSNGKSAQKFCVVLLNSAFFLTFSVFGSWFRNASRRPPFFLLLLFHGVGGGGGEGMLKIVNKCADYSVNSKSINHFRRSSCKVTGTRTARYTWLHRLLVKNFWAPPSGFVFFEKNKILISWGSSTLPTLLSNEAT